MVKEKAIPSESTFSQKMIFWLQSATWLMGAFLTLSGLNLHLFSVVLAIFEAKERDLQVVLFGLSNLLSAWLYGKLFFGIFLTPGSRIPLPNREVRLSSVKTFKMMLEVFFVMIASGCVSQYFLLFVQGSATVSLGSLIFLSTLVVLWMLTHLILHLRRRATFELYLTQVPNDEEKSLESSAFRKINRKLSEVERRELVDLLYKSERVGSMSVQNVARVIWTSCGVALFAELIEELIKRI